MPASRVTASSAPQVILRSEDKVGTIIVVIARLECQRSNGRLIRFILHTSFSQPSLLWPQPLLLSSTHQPPWKRRDLCALRHESFMEAPPSPFVIPTGAYPDFLPRCAGRGRVCAFCKGKAHEVYQPQQVPQEIRGSVVEGSAVQRTTRGNVFPAIFAETPRRASPLLRPK
jgi:hypothetical protein